MMTREQMIADLATAFDVDENHVVIVLQKAWWEEKLEQAKTVAQCRRVLDRIREISGPNVSPYLQTFAFRRAMEILQINDSRIMAGV